MISFSGQGINSVYLDLLGHALSDKGIFNDSRCGPVKDLGPVVLEFLAPGHQILFLKGRRYNPFFAFVEASWVLSGRNNLSDLQAIISSYSRFSDDGETLNGAYGYRMRNHFHFDQIEACLSILSKDNTSRRAVISLYEPADLINATSVDVPCNTAVYLKLRNNALDLTVVNRSNDLYLGVPYNVFVFGALQKYIAKKLGVDVGAQRHFSDSLHLYEEHIESVEKILSQNSNEEISSWLEAYPYENELFQGIFGDSESIAKLDSDRIESDYCRRIVQAFLSKKIESDNALIEALPLDAFGYSAQLWLESL